MRKYRNNTHPLEIPTLHELLITFILLLTFNNTILFTFRKCFLRYNILHNIFYNQQLKKQWTKINTQTKINKHWITFNKCYTFSHHANVFFRGNIILSFKTFLQWSYTIYTYWVPLKLPALHKLPFTFMYSMTFINAILFTFRKCFPQLQTFFIRGWN